MRKEPKLSYRTAWERLEARDRLSHDEFREYFERQLIGQNEIVPGFSLTRRELAPLIEYWTMELVHQDFLVWLSGSIGIEERAIMERINERLVMAGDLLHDQEALNEAFAAGVRRYGRQIDAEAWQAFLHGAEPTSDMLRRLGMLATDEETQPWPAPDSNLS